MKEDELSIVFGAKNASHLLTELSPYLEKCRRLATDKLKQMYQLGNFTESKMLAIAAELCTIDSIENDIRSKIKIGSKKSQGLVDGESRR